MRAIAILSLVVILGASHVASAEPTKSDKGAADLKAIQGKWKVVKIINQGKEVPADELAKADFQLSVTDATMEAMAKGQVVERYRIRLNPNSGPKEIDREPIDEKGQRAKVNYAGPKGEARYVDAHIEHGIYEISGDRLKICMAFLEQPRAKSFDPKDAKAYRVVELERAK
jgi:uncharacterized protein (TIGR03067 family)